MVRYVSFLVLAMAIAFATPALADLKCGDAPYQYGEDGLVVSWIGPVPKGAKVSNVDNSVFALLEQEMGSELPADFPDKYRKELQKSDLFNAQISGPIYVLDPL